jgi:hypothetical protein
MIYSNIIFFPCGDAGGKKHAQNPFTRCDQ